MTDQKLQELVDVLKWAESTVGLDWSNNSEIVPTRIDAWFIEARRHICEAARDHEDLETTSFLWNSELENRFAWRLGHAAARFGALNHQFDQGRRFAKQAQDRSSKNFSFQERKKAAENTYSSCIPSAEELLSNEAANEFLGRNGVLRHWGRAISTVALAYRGIDHEMVDTLLERAKELMRFENDDRSSILPSIPFVVYCCVRNRDEVGKNNEIYLDLVNTFSEALEKCDDLDTHVMAAGLYAMFSWHLNDDVQEDALQRTHRHLAKLDIQTNVHRNHRWVTHQIVQSLISYCSRGEDYLKSEVITALIDRLLLFPQKVIIDFALSDIDFFLKFNSFLDSAQKENILKVFFKEISNRDSENLFLLVYIIFVNSIKSDDEVYYNSCKKVFSSEHKVIYYWLYTLLHYGSASAWSDKVPLQVFWLSKFYKDNAENLPHELFDIWFEIVSNFTVALSVLDAGENLYPLTKYCEDDGNCDNLFWYVIVSILSVFNTDFDWPTVRVWVHVALDQVREHRCDSNISYLSLKIIDTLSARCADEDMSLHSEIQQRLEGAEQGFVGKSDSSRLAKSLQKVDQKIADAVYKAWDDSRYALSEEGCWNLLSRLELVEKRHPNSAASYIDYGNQWMLMRYGNRSAFEANVKKHACQSSDSTVSEPGLITQLPSKNFLPSKKLDFFQHASSIRSRKPSDYWTEMSLDEFSKLSIFGGSTGKKGLVTASSSYVSIASLPWCSEVQLLRFLDESWSNKSLVLYYLLCDGQLHPLSEGATVIHYVNRAKKIVLNEENFVDYLRFFCFFARDQNEIPFYCIQSIDEDVLSGSKNSKRNVSIFNSYSNLEYYGRNRNGDFVLHSPLLYGGHVFVAEFLVKLDGQIEMMADYKVATNTGIFVDQSIMFPQD